MTNTAPTKRVEDMSQEEWVAHYRTLCTFAYPGAYGHECGDKATKAGIKKLADGELYRARRCDRRSQIRGGENSGIIRWEAL